MWPQDRQHRHHQRNADSWAPPQALWVRSSKDFEKSSGVLMPENQCSGDWMSKNALTADVCSGHVDT